MVFQAARRGDHDIEAACHFFDLRRVFHAADNGGPRMGDIGAIFGNIVFDLAGQFPGRHNNQRRAGFWLRACACRDDVFKDGQNKSRRFARARLRNADDIATLADQRDDFFLDWRRGFIIMR